MSHKLTNIDSWGFVHLAKIFSLTALNVNGTHRSNGNFLEQTDNLWSYFQLKMLELSVSNEKGFFFHVMAQEDNKVQK